MPTGVDSDTRRRLPRAERSRQLLAIADAAFAQRGIRGTSMDDIAELAGVSKPVVYDHFGSKDGLVAAVVVRAGAELAEAVLSAVGAAGDPEAALASGVRAYFRFMQQRRRSWSALLSETATSSAAASALEQVRNGQAELIARLVSDGVPGCDLPRARLYAQLVVGGCERLATRAATARPPGVEALTQHVMDVIWLGFGEIRAGTRWEPTAD